MKFCKMLLALALFAIACLPAAAHAQQFQVPFSFVAAGRAFPAGEYRVEHLTGDGWWRIYNDRNSMMMLTNSVESPERAHPFSLIFEHVGDTYILHQLWPSQHSGRELFQLNARKSLVAKGATTYVQIGAE